MTPPASSLAGLSRLRGRHAASSTGTSVPSAEPLRTVGNQLGGQLASQVGRSVDATGPCRPSDAALGALSEELLGARLFNTALGATSEALLGAWSSDAALGAGAEALFGARPDDAATMVLATEDDSPFVALLPPSLVLAPRLGPTSPTNTNGLDAGVSAAASDSFAVLWPEASAKATE